jgi:hypothetical protein
MRSEILVRLNRLVSNGITKESYEKLMQGAWFETFHRALRTIVELKRKFETTKPAIRINYTVNPENLSELGRFS